MFSNNEFWQSEHKDVELFLYKKDCTDIGNPEISLSYSFFPPKTAGITVIIQPKYLFNYLVW